MTALAVNGSDQVTAGRVNPAQCLEDQGITGLGNVCYNFIDPVLMADAVRNGEGKSGLGGTLVSTVKFTGRSPKDKHVVRNATAKDAIWCAHNKPIRRKVSTT